MSNLDIIVQFLELFYDIITNEYLEDNKGNSFTNNFSKKIDECKLRESVYGDTYIV